MTTPSWSTCLRRSPASTSASSTRRTPRTATPLAAANNALNGSITGAGTGTGLSCTVANSGCPTLSSGPGSLDGSRATNQTVIGVRYQGVFGGVGLLAYAAYEHSGHATYTGPASTTAFGAANLGNTAAVGGTAAHFNGNYDGLSFGSGGVALTFAGFTVGGNIIGGRLNGQLALTPQGGAPEVGLPGRRQVCRRTFHGRHRGREWHLPGRPADDRADASVVAGGLTPASPTSWHPATPCGAEYMYQDIYQGGVNLVTGALGTNVEQQRQVARRDDRQRGQLLTRSLQAFRNRRRGHSPPLFSCLGADVVDRAPLLI